MIKIDENQDKDVTYENEPDSQRQLFPNIPLTVDVSPLQDAIDSIMTTLQSFDGQPGVAETVSDMTDTNKIYVYVGSETGYTSGDWYYYDGTAWVSGGEYVANPVQIDDTLTQAGEAADAKATGDEIAQIKSDFDACLQIKGWQEQDFALSTDKLRDNTTFAESTSSSFNNTFIAVSEGEQYKISGWSNESEYAPAYWSDNALVSVIKAPRGAFTDYITTVPTGATKMMINGRSTIPIAILKNIQTSESVDFINNVNWKHLGVQRTLTDQINVFMSNYDVNTDLECRFTRKSGNNLPDIQGWYRCANNSGYVLTESDGTEEYILKSTSDFLGPSVIYAVNNMDGDFPNLTDRKLTGGWHMYDNATSGDYSATARNVSLTVECDGKSVEQGKSANGNEIVITIVNRLQASNTEKSDGNGREVAELTYRITFREGFKADIYGTIKALEDIHYAEFIGISAYLMSGQPFRWVGSRTNRQAITPSSSAQRCGDKYCTAILQTGTTDAFEIAIDPTYDLGTMYANKWTNSFSSSSNKGYANYINQDGERTDESRLSLLSGDMVHWHGFYNLYSV